MRCCLGNELTDYESEFERSLKIKKECEEQHQVISDFQGMSSVLYFNLV